MQNITTTNNSITPTGVPVQSYGNLLDNLCDNSTKKGAYGFFIDYFNFNLQGVPHIENSDKKEIYYVPEELGTKIFKYRGKVYDGERLLGTMLFCPNSSALNPLLTQFKLENSLFYTMPLSEIKNTFKKVLKTFNLKFTSVNRLDLALDFNGLAHDIERLITAFSLRAVKFSGREKDVNFYSKTKNGLIDWDGMTIGNRANTKFGRLYNKTKELKKNLKTYINDAHKELGLNFEIWRFEYQLNNGFLRNLDGITLDNLFNIDFLFGLYERATFNYFDIKQNTGLAETNKEKDVNFLNMEQVRRNLKYLKKSVKTIKRVIKETLIGQQRMVKGLLRSYVSSGQKEAFLFPLYHIITDFDLSAWFEWRLPQYLKEFQNKMILGDIDVQKLHNDLGIVVCA